MSIETQEQMEGRKSMVVCVSRGSTGYHIQIPELGRVSFNSAEDAEACLRRMGYSNIQRRSKDGQK
jgi:hypothetical protein